MSLTFLGFTIWILFQSLTFIHGSSFQESAKPQARTPPPPTYTPNIIIDKLQELDKAWANRLPANSTKEYSQLLFEYGKILFYGNLTGVEGSFPKAYTFFRLAAEQGNVQSNFYLALMHFFQLDGNFIMQSNFNNLYKNKYNFLLDYITKTNTTKTAIYLYLGSVQDSIQSSFALANFYQKGVVMEKKCPSSALYLKKVSDFIFSEAQWEDNYVPIFIDKRRLDKEYFSNLQTTKEVDEFLNDSPEELEYIRMSAELGKISYLVEMAKIHLYGLRGQNRDYKKSFIYFQRAADLGDIASKTQVGIMYIRGLGVEVNYKKALTLLHETALRRDNRAKNALGYMYMNGLGTSMSIADALTYFHEAADANVTDAQYNYGALIQSQTDKEGNLDKNKKFGHHYINLASMNGHLLAQYHLGLSYLEGSDVYYSCDLSVRLLRAACDRGPWGEILRTGYQAFRAKNYRLALAIYLEAAFLGYEIGYTNAAIILDKHYTLTREDINFKGLPETLEQDQVFKTLQRMRRFVPPANIKTFLFRDYIDAIHDFNSFEERFNTLDNLLDIDSSPQFSTNITKKVMMLLYYRMAEENEPFSLYRVAESYRLGDIIPQNFTLAFDYYRKVLLNTEVTSKNHENAYIVSQSYYHLGYMRHYGLGVDKNLSKAVANYNYSALINKNSGLLAFYMMKVAQLEESNSKLFALYRIGTFDLQSEAWKAHISPFLETIPFYILSLCLIGLCVLRVRLHNYINIFLTGKN